MTWVGTGMYRHVTQQMNCFGDLLGAQLQLGKSMHFVD